MIKFNLEIKKPKRIYFIIAIIFVIIMCGVSFAYFLASESSSSKTLAIKNISVDYSEGDILKNNNFIPLYPDEVLNEATKLNFTITNDGEESVYVNIDLSSITIDQELKTEEMKWALYEGNNQVSSGDFLDSYSTLSLLKNITFAVGNTKNYTVYAWINETDGNQSSMQGKSLSGKIKVTASYKKNIDNRLANYKIYGNSIQDTVTYGEPSPTNQVDVVSLGEHGKNLIDTSIIHGGSIVYDKTINGFRNSGYQCFAPFNWGKYLKPNTTYTLFYNFTSSVGTNTVIGRVVMANGYSSSLKYIISNVYTKGWQRGVFTTPADLSNANYIWLYGASVMEDFMILEGDVSLENRPEYRPYKYIDVESSGKNLFNKNDLKDWYINSSSSLVISSAYSGAIVKVKPNTTYTLSNKIYGYNDFYAFFSDMPASNSTSFNNSRYMIERATTKGTITTPTGANYMFYSNSIGFENFQIEEGLAATSYEPYTEQTTTIDLTGHEPLRKIGDVADYIDYSNGKIVRKTGKIVFDGITNNRKLVYKNLDDGDYKSFYFDNVLIGLRGEKMILNTHFPFYEWIPPTGNYWWSSQSSNGMRINSSYLTNYDDNLTVNEKVTVANNWLAQEYTAGKPVTIYYQLAKPTYENIDLPDININSEINTLKVVGTNQVNVIK